MSDAPADAADGGLDLYDEAFAVFAALDRAGTPYCLIGGTAVSFYAEPRFTRDIDLLTVPDAAAGAADAVRSCGFKEAVPPWTFASTGATLWRFAKLAGESRLLLDLLYDPGEKVRAAVAGAVADASARGPVRVAARETLIALTRERSSLQDLADIAPLTGRDRPDGPPPLRVLPARPPLPPGATPVPPPVIRGRVWGPDHPDYPDGAAR